MKSKSLWLSLFLFAAFPAWAQTPPAPPSVSVSGDAKELVTPDRAIVSVSVVSEHAQLAAAKTDNDARVEKLVKLAERIDIPKEKINTSQVSISPKYSYEQKTGRQNFDGYTVSRSFVLTVDELGNVEKLLSAIVDAKLDRVDNVEYTLKDPKSSGDRLRAAAFADAKSKAQALADAAGAKLGRALEIAAGSAAPSHPRPMMEQKMMLAAAESSVAPSLPGQLSVMQVVSVTFALEY